MPQHPVVAADSRASVRAQYCAVAFAICPVDLAINERVEGGRPANAAAHASTACPVGPPTGNARPCPAGADRPGTKALS